MKSLFAIVLSAIALCSLPAFADKTAVTEAFEAHQSNVQLEGAGEVMRLLPDDTNGAKHQKFVLRLEDGSTVLVAHNIDLAQRVDKLKIGDAVQFSGEYEWNRQGGVIHWTHDDPQGQHEGGWLYVNGRSYH
jgi:hypothetical protein